MRNPLGLLRSSFITIRRNLLRSALTVLGIVIGVAAVIAMMEIGNGVTRVMQQSVASLGSNTLVVFPGSMMGGGISMGAGSRLTLTPGDAEAIARECPSVESVAPIVNLKAQLVYGNQNWSPGDAYGTTPDLLLVRDWKVVEGAPFTDRDVRAAAAVCLLGQTASRALFGPASPVGKEIRVQNVNVRVVGVLDRKGSDLRGRDQDDSIILPWTTVKYRIAGGGGGAGSGGGQAVPKGHQAYPGSSAPLYPVVSATRAQNSPVPVRFVNVDMIRVSAVSSEAVPAAVDEIVDLLHERHRLPKGEEDDFSVLNLSEIAAMRSQLTDLMTGLLLILALISLLVGGVGIMNIMLVSVTERTKEIGLRMAVGAKSRDILLQFLTEAVVLCLCGGILGILAGRGASLLVSHFKGWAVEPSFWGVVIAVGVSSVVGVVFGFYPAWKASRLDPIEALRYE